MINESVESYEDFLKLYGFTDSEHNKFRYICHKIFQK